MKPTSHEIRFLSRKTVTQGVRNRLLVELALSQLFGLYPGRVEYAVTLICILKLNEDDNQLFSSINLMVNQINFQMV
jgi:hypothetical protein